MTCAATGASNAPDLAHSRQALALSPRGKTSHALTQTLSKQFPLLTRTPLAQELAAAARDAGKTNVAFLARFLLQDVDACVELLIASGRLPEAAFFARTYRPSRVPELVKLWQNNLKTVSAKAAESLASPEEYPNLFPDWEAALAVEKVVMGGAGKFVAAASYPSLEGSTGRDLIALAASPTLAPQVRRILLQIRHVLWCHSHSSLDWSRPDGARGLADARAAGAARLRAQWMCTGNVRLFSDSSG
jgi:Coatomer WD associated region